MPMLKRFLDEVNVVNEGDVEVLEYDEVRGLITCKVGSIIYRDLVIRRPFPITNPDFLLFVRQDDGKIAFTVRDVNKLRDGVRDIVRRILNRFYFMPTIIRIRSLDTSGDEFVWEVETDRGSTTIRTRGRSSVVSFGSRIVIVDINDVVYQIPDINKLDRRSRKIIESLI